MASPHPIPEYEPEPDGDTNAVAANREAWLARAIDRYFRPMFAQLGYTVPETVHVSVGWGYGRAGAESKIILGNCWSGVTSEDSAPHVFISPTLVDPAQTLAVLAHELVHATLDPIMDHGKEFKALATAIGLLGPMTATTADISTSAEYMLMTEDGGELGPYPHSAIHLLDLPVRLSPVPQVVGGPRRRVSSGPAPQEARWVRVVCPDHGTGAFAVRTSRRAVEQGQAPLCGESGSDGVPCGVRMVLPG